MIKNYKAVLGKYADFTGRAGRSEYWYFTLMNILIGMLLGFVSGIFSVINESLEVLGLGLIWVYQLAIIIPSLAVGTRRLHDTGRSGWWWLIALTGIGSIVLIIFFCMKSEAGTNKWGPNAHEATIADASSHLVD